MTFVFVFTAVITVFMTERCSG